WAGPVVGQGHEHVAERVLDPEPGPVEQVTERVDGEPVAVGKAEQVVVREEESRERPSGRVEACAPRGVKGAAGDADGDPAAIADAQACGARGGPWVGELVEAVPECDHIEDGAGVILLEGAFVHVEAPTTSERVRGFIDIDAAE